MNADRFQTVEEINETIIMTSRITHVANSIWGWLCNFSSLFWISRRRKYLMKAESQYAICEGAVLCSDSRVGSHQRSTADWRSAACVCLCVIIIYQAALSRSRSGFLDCSWSYVNRALVSQPSPTSGNNFLNWLQSIEVGFLGSFIIRSPLKTCIASSQTTKTAAVKDAMLK